MYQKTVFFKDGESAHQILETESPVKARNIGKKMPIMTVRSGTVLPKTVCTRLCIQSLTKINTVRNSEEKLREPSLLKPIQDTLIGEQESS